MKRNLTKKQAAIGLIVGISVAIGALFYFGSLQTRGYYRLKQQGLILSGHGTN